jgi:PAS domain S-box-containing protein
MKLPNIKSWIQEPENPLKLAAVLSFPLVLILTLLSLSVIHWEKKSIEDIQRKNMLMYARSLFQHIITSPIWRGPHGGYFVEVTQHIERTDTGRLYIMGKEYVRVDPSIYNQTIETITKKRAAYRFHLTSLESEGTVNSPDRWERESIKKFVKGLSNEELTSIKLAGTIYYRYIAPIELKGRCLNCHKNLNAAMSIDIPVDFANRLYAAQLKRSVITFASFGLLMVGFVILITGFFSKRISDGFKEIKRLNQSLHELSARNQKVLDSIVDAIVVIDNLDRIEMVNPVFTEMTGVEAENLLGRGINEFEDETLRRIFDTSDGEEIEIKGRQYIVREIKVADRDYEYGRLRILHDATKEKLSAAVELSAAAAHELRQPLAIILNLSEVIKAKVKEGEDIREELEAMESQCIRMNETISKMLNITRYRTKMYTEDIKILDLDSENS